MFYLWNILLWRVVLDDWKTHRDVCIPRLVMANSMLRNSSILDQYTPPTCNVVPKQDKLSIPVTNGVLTTKISSDVQTRKDSISVASVASGLGMAKTSSDAQKLKNNMPAGTVSNREKPILNMMKNPLNVSKANKPVASTGSEQEARCNILRNVKISYVANDRLYIYDAGSGPNDESNSFQSLILRSLECGMGIKDSLSTPPTIGDIVFAPFEDDFYRAVDGIADVFFPDIGNSLKVEWKKLKTIPDQMLKYAKIVTHPVWIDNVKSLTPRMRDFLVTLVDLHELVLTTVIDLPNTHMRLVDMRHVRQQYVLSELLLVLTIGDVKHKEKKKIASQVRPPNNVPKLVVTNPNTYKAELVESYIANNNGVELVITYALHAFSLDKISVIKKSDYTVFEKTVKECQTYGQIDPNPYKTQENEVCLVKIKDLWHRGTP
uniref:Uncharacterized protein n=1 Tax=Anopheles christyi TaxID=43041 RepID=A0A182JPK5_9DIPT